MNARNLFVAAGLGLALGVQAAELPHRKPGLWETSMKLESSRLPPVHTRLCLDADTDVLLYRYGMGLSGEHCMQSEVVGSGSEFTLRSTCTIGNRRVSTQMTLTLDGNTVYRMVGHSHHEPPLNGRSDTHSEQEGHWVGACEPGQRPGDMVISPPGIRLNVREALGKK